ncbi:RHS repeat-associated core domain-containing protein [Pseudomonas moraviensis subsp. stanleyae]|nr:RHS repeat-associated core domain-containing protein [Pseudomonas moraviensis subsp. stanleyae]
MHSKTPTLAVNDPRGLAILTVNYWRTDASLPGEPRIERTLRDVDGRAISQWDARLWALQAIDPQTPASLASVYSLNDSLLRSDSTDAGIEVQLPGLAGEMLFSWDSRGTCRHIEYDDLLRPLAVFEEGAGEPRRCAERFAYGRPGAGEPLRNQLGQLIRHDDPAGSVLFEQFAITGQCSENTRQFTLEPFVPNWPEADVERRLLLESEGATTRWRFSPQGSVLEQVDAGGHRQVFALTLDGRLRRVGLRLRHQTSDHPVVSDIRYNAEGQVTRELAGNGVLTTLSYSPEDGRLLIRHAQDPLCNVWQHLLYAYDPMGNVLSIEDQALPVRWFANQRIEPVSRYRYDSLYQLIHATGWEAGAAGGGPTAVVRYTEEYHHDAGGNLLELTHVGAQSPGHQLQAARYSNRCLPWRDARPPDEAEIAAAFDARGNLLLLDQGRQLRWNLRNQLASVVAVQRESGANDDEAYLYDGAGLRVRKMGVSLTNARHLLADVRYLPALELRTDTGSGERLQVITVQTELNSVRVLHWESPAPTGINDLYRYSFSDHLGSISLELDADARLISREHFYPYGATAWADEPDVSYKTVRYSGKERDATGLYYYGYRYYMPWLQRWLNPDPKGFVDGPNLFQMAGNSPIRYVDSDGGSKGDTSELAGSAQKQSALLESMTSAAADVRNSLLNHTQARHRFRALARRVVTQLASRAVSAGAQAVGGAVGGGLGGAFGPMGGALGTKLGSKAGSKLADAAINTVVDAYQLNRPINFTGREMNPKAFVESVEPKKQRTYAQVKLEMSAHDFRTSEGRSRLFKVARTKVEDKMLSVAGDKLGAEAPGLIQTGREFVRAAQGLDAEALSQTWEDIPVDIDMATFRTQAIVTELATAGSSDAKLFEAVSELSVKTASTVQTLERTQDFIGLVAPRPYAGRQQSMGGYARPTPRRQNTHS